MVWNRLTNLKALHLNSNKLLKGHHNIELVAEIFSTFTKIEVLWMHENSISEDDFIVLCEVFSNYANLKHLNLSRNGLTAESISTFRSHLVRGRFGSLKHLDMSFNRIGEDGFETLLYSLMKSKHMRLKEFYLRGMTLYKEVHLPMVSTFIKSIMKPGFKKLNFKPNNLRKDVLNEFKDSLIDSYSSRLII